MPEIPQPPHPVVAVRAAILAHGLQPIAVYTRGKRPFGSAWEQTRGAPPFVAAALSTGILCDGIRGIDGDIDDAESAATARRIVLDVLGPSTVVRTRPDSSRFLIVYRGTGRKRVIKTDAGKVEILGQGQQFVAYGVHPDGAPFEWLDDEPAAKRLNGRVVDEADLDRLEAALHAALGGNQPEAEQRPATPAFDPPRGNRPGEEWARAALEREVDAVAGAPKGARNATLNTAAFNLGQIVAGGALARSEVEERLTQAAIGACLTAPETRATLRSGLAAGAREPRAAPERTIEVPPTVVEAAAGMAANPARAAVRPDDPFASISIGRGVDWRTPRGLIGQISDWILETSRRPNRPLAVAAATAVLSAVCGRGLYGPTGTALNLYIVTLAKTGAGKDRPLSAIEEVLRAAKLEHLWTTGKAFHVSGYEKLIEQKPGCVATIDEIGPNLLARIANKRSGHGESEGVKATLQELWSRSFGRAPFMPNHRAQTAAQPVASPSLTLYGASTPEAFYDCFKGGDALSGFLNRFLIADAAERQKVTNDFDYFSPPADVLRDLRDLIPQQDGNLGATNQSIKERKMRWADGATKASAEALDNDILDILDVHPHGGLMARTYEYSVRLASLHAVSQGRLAVDRADLEWGASWAMESARAMIVAAAELMAETEHEGYVNKVKAIIKKEGVIGRRDLARRTQWLKSRDRDGIIEQLAEAEIIEKLDVKSAGAPAKRTYRWVG